MSGLIAELKYQFRYRLPMWLVGLLTNWWPDNRVTIKIRGAMLRPFFKKCGRNFTISRNVTFASPHNIEIGNDVYVATGAWLNGLGGLIIEDEVEISPYVVIDTCVHTFRDNSVRLGGSVIAPVRIGRGSWLAAHSVVRAGVDIGSGVLVAGNAAVVKDVPDNVMVGGVPAKVIGPRKEKDQASVIHGRYIDKKIPASNKDEKDDS
jgi:acetyltransferase-like isoleucine patch superfamily enzyme